jgi:DNA-binding response OmpR family regulator
LIDAPVKENAMTTTVLIIEKDDPRLKLMEWGLLQDGFDVTVASGPHAVAGGQAARPDVIVMNTGMPAESKRIWIAGLRYLVPDVKIVDLPSGPHDAEYDSGADAYLREPFRLDALHAIVETLLGRPVSLRETKEYEPYEYDTLEYPGRSAASVVNELDPR